MARVCRERGAPMQSLVSVYSPAGLRKRPCRRGVVPLGVLRKS